MTEAETHDRQGSRRRLAQTEIDAVVSAVRSAAIAPSPGSLVPVLRARPANLADPRFSRDRIVRRRLPVLDHVFERLGPLLQITLTKNLKFPVRVDNDGVTLQKFSELRGRYDKSSALFEAMRLDPLRGLSIIALDGTLIYALVDALMGGLGVGDVPADRDVSEIEVTLLYKVRTELFRDFENAWRPWFPMTIEHVRSNRSIGALSSMGDEEVCHVGTLAISGDVLPRTPVCVVMPYSSLEPLFDATSPQSGEDIDPSWRVNVEQGLRRARVELTARLGEVDLPATRVRRLVPGDVIELESHSGDEIDLLVEREPVFRAQIGQNHLQYAVQVRSRRSVQRETVDRTVGQQLVRKGLISREQLQVARVDERINRRPLLESIVARGWVERRVLESALGT
jgi:flagellar motor switch protein FliM